MRVSDAIGIELMAKAGFNPSESITLWQKMAQASQGSQPVEFLSTHPSPETRIDDLRGLLPKAMPLMQQARAAAKTELCEINSYSFGSGSLAGKSSSTFAPSGS